MDCVESVFVGEVVADVDRQQGTRRVDAVTDPGQRGPFVPVEVGPQLDEHAPVGHPQAISLPEFMCGRDDLADVLRCNLAVVHRDGEALVFYPYSGNLRQALAQLGCRTLEHGHGGGGRFVLVVGAVRCGQLKAVAARVPETRYGDPGADIGEVAAAQYRDGALCR